MRVVTANVQCTLDLNAAGRCLDAVLGQRPDVVLLQEWALKRVPLLIAQGRTSVVPGGLGSLGRGAYRWFAPITGGCAVGVRLDRFDAATARLVSLSRPGWSEGQRVQPGRTAVAVRALDRVSGQPTCLVSYHLIPGAQDGGGYDSSRPHQASRHRSEGARLQRCIDRALRQGVQIFAGGDSNFAGFALDGLTSAWTTTARIDDVFATMPAQAVIRIETESDHPAVVVDY